jgi:acyl-CoA thioesterase-1
MYTRIKTPITLIFFLFTFSCFAQTQLIKNLQAGKKQTLVVYGTSLSAYSGGVAWVNELAAQLNARYHNNLTVYNSAKSAMWSTWGVQHLEDSVIKKNPDAILLEFSMNDGFLQYKTSPELARLNLDYMLDRVKLYNPNCQMILQIMNLPINQNALARPNLQAYFQMYREVAKQRGLLLIDHSYYWQKILDKGKDVYLKYVPDGIHPDAKSGRELIAPFILKKLEE